MLLFLLVSPPVGKYRYYEVKAIRKMNTVLVWIGLLALGVVAFVALGLFDICLHRLLRFFHYRYKRLRRHQRPSRIFLIRHGESQANVDTSIIKSISTE